MRFSDLQKTQKGPPLRGGPCLVNRISYAALGGGNRTGPTGTAAIKLGGGSRTGPTGTAAIKLGGGSRTGPTGTATIKLGGGSRTGPTGTAIIKLGGGSRTGPTGTAATKLGGGSRTGPTGTALAEHTDTRTRTMTPNLRATNVRELMGLSPGGDNSASELCFVRVTQKVHGRYNKSVIRKKFCRKYLFFLRPGNKRMGTLAKFRRIFALPT